MPRRLEEPLEYGDGRSLDYISEGQGSKKEAQKAAFVEILSYILFRGPKQLRHHANQWHVPRLHALRLFVEFRLRGLLGPRPREQWTPLSHPNRQEEQETRTKSWARGNNRRAELAYLLL